MSGPLITSTKTYAEILQRQAAGTFGARKEWGQQPVVETSRSDHHKEAVRNSVAHGISKLLSQVSAMQQHHASRSAGAATSTSRDTTPVVGNNDASPAPSTPSYGGRR
ncbi:hypothetical protein BH10PSE19_BH10PSE19_03350 [soil metagenome]